MANENAEFIREPAAGLQIVTNPNAPTILVEGAVGMQVTNGIIKVNLFQNFQDFEADGKAQTKRMIVARLAMSPSTLRLVLNWLSENLDTIESLPQRTNDGQTTG